MKVVGNTQNLVIHVVAHHIGGSKQTSLHQYFMVIGNLSLVRHGGKNAPNVDVCFQKQDYIMERLTIAQTAAQRWMVKILKYNIMFPDMHHLQVISGILYCDDARPCCMCGHLTHYVDICYEARFCSTECMDEFEKDLKDINYAYNFSI